MVASFASLLPRLERIVSAVVGSLHSCNALSVWMPVSKQTKRSESQVLLCRGGFQETADTLMLCGQVYRVV